MAFAEVKMVHLLGKEKLFLTKTEAKLYRQPERLLKPGKAGISTVWAMKQRKLSL